MTPQPMRRLVDLGSEKIAAAVRRARENQRLARLAILGVKIAEADEHAADRCATVYVPHEVVGDVFDRTLAASGWQPPADPSADPNPKEPRP